MDDAGIRELLSMADFTTPAVDSMAPSPTVTQQAVEDNSAPASGTGQAPESTTPSVVSNTLQDPPPSPTTAYCVNCDAYHYVGSRDFSPHEISGCEDPHGGTTVFYPTISECERALDA
jgi:hypothetical protein